MRAVVIAGALVVGGCAGPSDVAGTPTATEAAEVPWNGDPLVGVFPPSWSVGDRWAVVMTVPDDRQEVAMANPPRLWLDIEYQFEVLSAPEGDDGEYRVAIDSERLHYVATYSKRPFALDRLEDRSGWSLPIIRLPGAPKAPCLSGVVAAFITDFPAPPDAAVPGKQPLRIQGMMGSVEIAPTAEGARWTYGTILSVETFTWARGAPWWSTVEKHVPPEFGAPEMEPKAFSGRLVSFTRR